MIPLFRPFVAPGAACAVANVLAPREDGSIYLGQGQVVEEFEKALQEFTGCAERPLSVNSCTSAITLALHLLDIGPNDSVVTTPMTCLATNSPILHTGAEVIWADIDPITGLIDPRSVRQKIKKNTKAIMAVDWAGQVCDYQSLNGLGIPVIQDAAHSLAAWDAGTYVVYSFQAIKHLTTGDGGALVAPADQYERAKLLRWYGFDRAKGQSFRCSQDVTEVGYKFHMNDIAASIGLANLPHLQKVMEQYYCNASFLTESLAGIQTNRFRVCSPIGYKGPLWFFPVLVSNRDDFKSHMEKWGVETSPVHRRNDELSIFAKFRAELPGVDAFSTRAMGLPCHYALAQDDLNTIVKAVEAWA